MIYINFPKNKFSGFTLIELLIVIAVIGVLAAVILVAVDPLEQLARSRDAGRKNAVGQVSRAMQAYMTAQARTNYPWVPADFTNRVSSGGEFEWQNALVRSQDLKQPVTVSSFTNDSGTTIQCNVNRRHNDICYNPDSYEDGDFTEASIWVLLESKADRNKADCATSETPAFVWSSAQGKTGYSCLSSYNALPNRRGTLTPITL